MDGHFPANAPMGRRAVVEKEASAWFTIAGHYLPICLS